MALESTYLNQGTLKSYTINKLALQNDSNGELARTLHDLQTLEDEILHLEQIQNPNESNEYLIHAALEFYALIDEGYRIGLFMSQHATYLNENGRYPS